MTAKEELREALETIVMEPIIGSRHMKRLRADGVVDTVRLELGMPQEHHYGEGRAIWTCSMRMNILPRVMNGSGSSSLDAILSATYLAAAVLKSHPNGPEIDMSLVPNFQLPFNPVTTTPEALAEEQKRPKKLRLPSADREIVITKPIEPTK